MERICSQCHAVLAEETKADWCPACGGALVERVKRFRIARTPRRLKSIIAASCCRGDTRWAGLLRRSEPLLAALSGAVKAGYRDRPPRQAAWRSSKVQNRRPSTPVRRPRGASQECGRRESGRIAGQDRCWFPRSFRKFHEGPNSGTKILLKLGPRTTSASGNRISCKIRGGRCACATSDL